MLDALQETQTAHIHQVLYLSSFLLASSSQELMSHTQKSHQITNGGHSTYGQISWHHIITTLSQQGALEGLYKLTPSTPAPCLFLTTRHLRKGVILCKADRLSPDYWLSAGCFELDSFRVLAVGTKSGLVSSSHALWVLPASLLLISSHTLSPMPSNVPGPSQIIGLEFGFLGMVCSTFLCQETPTYPSSPRWNLISSGSSILHLHIREVLM